ncbi:MAG: hypothetical protein NVSMB9_30390 [Isosphaeraceae bacterium]
MLTSLPFCTTELRTSASPFVLLVDDDEPCLKRLRKVVESAGYVCETSNSAPDALVYCDERPPALVVTDLSMPRLDGRGLARWIKARYPTVPILLLSGEVFAPHVQAPMTEFFDAILSKPLQIDVFLTLLEDLMPPMVEG